MLWSLIRGAGRLALWLATMAFLTAVSIFIIGSFLLTWPILRKSPRDRKLRATMDFASAGATMLAAYSDASLKKMVAEAMTEETEESEGVVYPFVEGGALILGPECFVAKDGSVLNWRGENFIPQNLTSTAEKAESTYNDPDAYRTGDDA